MASETRIVRRHDDDDYALVGRAAPPGPPSRQAESLGAASRFVGLLLKLTLLGILVAVLVGIVGLIGWIGVGSRAGAGLSDQVSGALTRGAGALANAVQVVRDATDASHPPRQTLAQDTEFEELIRVDVGFSLPAPETRTLVFSGVQRRDGAESPDAAVYAVVHSELKAPRETRVLGIVVRTDRDPRDYYLYKGESFRIGRRLYKVNWVSLDRRQMAVAAYRDPDRVTGPLKFELD
jgi:hypothetical protein